MWGAGIVSAWAAWEEPVAKLRELEDFPGTFEYFQDLAEVMGKMTKKRARRLSRDEAAVSATQAEAEAEDRMSECCGRA